MYCWIFLPCTYYLQCKLCHSVFRKSGEGRFELIANKVLFQGLLPTNPAMYLVICSSSLERGASIDNSVGLVEHRRFHINLLNNSMSRSVRSLFTRSAEMSALNFFIIMLKSSHKDSSHMNKWKEEHICSYPSGFGILLSPEVFLSIIFSLQMPQRASSYYTVLWDAVSSLYFQYLELQHPMQYWMRLSNQLHSLIFHAHLFLNFSVYNLSGIVYNFLACGDTLWRHHHILRATTIYFINPCISVL